MFFIIFTHLSSFLLLALLCFFLLYCFESLLFLYFSLSFLCLFLAFVIFLFPPFLLLSTGINDFLHFLIVDFSLDFHVFGVFLLLVLELYPAFFDLFFSAFELMVELCESLLVSLSSLSQLVLLFVSFQIRLFFLFFVELFHHANALQCFPLHLLLPLYYLLLLFLEVLLFLAQELFLFCFLLLLYLTISFVTLQLLPSFILFLPLFLLFHLLEALLL